MKFMDSLGTAARRVVVFDDNVAANGAQCVRQSMADDRFSDLYRIGNEKAELRGPHCVFGNERQYPIERGRVETGFMAQPQHEMCRCPVS